tara:strand:+ start:2976 stop:3236 length:261 start_codon:yes stop_codon:yes gene_type:complete
MKYIFFTLILITSLTVSSAAKWDKPGCNRIEAGVGQLIGASESMRGLSEGAGRDGDSEAENELREMQLFYLESASYWSTIYAAFCK